MKQELPKGSLETPPATDEAISDPIITLVAAVIREDIADDFIVHLASLSDVVKADMRAVMSWNNHDIDKRLNQMIRVSLDENDRYRFRPENKSGGEVQKFSAKYVQAQSLLTEWVSIYRTLGVYIAIRRRQLLAAGDDGEVIWVG